MGGWAIGGIGCANVFHAAIEDEDMEMREFKMIVAALIMAMAASFFVLGSVGAIAETLEQAPSPGMTSKKEPKKSAASLEARHRDCLAFIQRHGMSCDPWETPTCGHDIGYVRPPSCVAP
jgi:hypothetical protein